jgi:hypothetical protein
MLHEEFEQQMLQIASKMTGSNSKISRTPLKLQAASSPKMLENPPT